MDPKWSISDLDPAFSSHSGPISDSLNGIGSRDYIQIFCLKWIGTSGSR